MKNIFITGIIGMLLLLSACTGSKSLSRGLENEAFIELIGNDNVYGNGVTVSIDDEITFNARVNKDSKPATKGEVYAISPGRHVISVLHNGREIYRKQIFVSPQETKRIVLP